jgi:dihydroorotate dehydrogenase (fumarate)
MVDLATRYLGLELGNPLIASASPLNAEIDNLRRLVDAGAAAVVLPSLFEEQIEAEERWTESVRAAGTESYAEALTYFPRTSVARGGTHRYLDFVEQAVGAVDVPVIGSLNGTTAEGWVSYARQIEQAGAAALELNLYLLATDPSVDGRAVERRYLEVLDAVRAEVTIPLAVKLGPYFSSPGHMALELERHGADGLVLFNRFYQPDVDVLTLSLRNDIELSQPSEIRLPLLWIGVLAGRTTASLAASTGVDSAQEVVKYLLVGADVVMTASALLRHGPEHMGVLLRGLRAWLSARGFESLEAVRGLLSHRLIGANSAFERTNYMEILGSYTHQGGAGIRPAGRP